MPKSSATILTRRALNRAFLARQMLLKREKLPVLKAIERLCALQAQQPRPPHVNLWSRLDGYQPGELTQLAQERRIVRVTLMRATLHLMTAPDYLAWRATIAPALDAALASMPRSRLSGLDLEAVAAFAVEAFGKRAQPFGDLREDLEKAFPGVDVRIMGYAARLRVPLVVVPDRSVWGYRPDGDFTLAEHWLGKPVQTQDSAKPLILRYLAAFGPAAPTDAQRWLGVKNLRSVFEELRPQLVSFCDERGRELFDLPEAPRPPEETAAPVRFLAEFDNVILGHDERSRIIEEAHRPRLLTRNLLVPAILLVDGFVAGTWRTAATRKAARLTVVPFVRLSKVVQERVTREGEQLLRFLEPGTGKVEVEFSSQS